MNEDRIKEFVRFTASGIEVADFSEIRSAIIERYQDAYGSDIDLSTSSADGVFVNNLALIINNILQTMITLYSNLDVNNATGEYLDTLCSLSNVKRKDATYSNTSILITNVGNNPLTLSNLSFLDNAGTIWNYSSQSPITLQRNETQEINVVCSELGPVKAPAGFIKTLVNPYPLTISQPNDANVGLDVETDDSLRARRSQSLGINGLTVLQSLSGALLDVSGIRDVYIYNNNSASTYVTKDGTSVPSHGVYAIVRLEKGITVLDETIGTIIHNKLTPGISTTETDDATYATSKNYTYVEKVYNTILGEECNQEIYWKEAIPMAPEFSITINTYEYFTEDEIDVIGERILNYLNNIGISKEIDTNKLMLEMIDADPKFKGNPTYYVSLIDSNDQDFEKNYDTYFEYTTVTYAAGQQPNTYVITFE